MRKCTGDEYAKLHCQTEKMGCFGCYYYKNEKQTSRKLASVQKIKAIRPIEGADRIEIVQVLDWDCVATKNQFQVGDLVIYFEIDSLLPDIPAFEFLKKSCWSQKLNKYKIKTHKFRNQISQGLVIPIEQLQDIIDEVCYPVEVNIGVPLEEIPEGFDLTEFLHIEKYEPPVLNGPLGETIQHEWYIPKTDEERIQTCAETVLPEYMKSEQNDWYASIKLDGTSCTVGLFYDAFLIGGRNQWYKDENMYTTTVKKYGDLEAKLKAYHKKTGYYLAFQGELCGPGIQCNRLGLKEKEWFVFNIWISETGKIDSYEKVDLLRMLNFCELFNLKYVPIIDYNQKFIFKETTDIHETVEKLLKYTDNFKYKTYFENASPNQIAEGLVFRKNDMTNSFKVVSNKYLLNGGE